LVQAEATGAPSFRSSGSWVLSLNMEASERPTESPSGDQPPSPAAPEEAELAARQTLFEAFWAQVDEEEQEERFAPEVAELTARQAEFDNFWLRFDMEQSSQSSKSAVLNGPEMEELETAELDSRQQDFDQFWLQQDSEVVVSPVASESELQDLQRKRRARKKRQDIEPAKISLSIDDGTQSELASALLVGSPSRSIRRHAKDSLKAGYGGSTPSRAPGGYSTSEVPNLPLSPLEMYGTKKLTDQYKLSSPSLAFATSVDLQQERAPKPARLTPLNPSRSSSFAALHERLPKSSGFSSKALLLRLDGKPENSADSWSIGSAVMDKGLTRSWSSSMY